MTRLVPLTIRLYIETSIEKVGCLPTVGDASTNIFLKEAALESFLGNVRLLSEFMVRSPKAMDYHASVYPDWPWNNINDLSHADSAERLSLQWWELASKEVMHLSKKRDPESEGGFSDAPEGWMKMAAQDTINVFTDFVDHVKAVAPEDASEYDSSLQRAIAGIESYEGR